MHLFYKIELEKIKYYAFVLAVMCPALQNPQNGFVIVNEFTIGSVATYGCNPGFTLVGAQTRECTQLTTTSTDWIPAAPVCVRKSLHKDLYT